MRKTFLTMSLTELNRLELMRRLLERSLTQRSVAEQLGLSIRQVQRLLVAYRREGPAGLVSKKRGAAGNHCLPPEVRPAALALIKARYHDFGPTLACEKLAELHGIDVSRETVRRWMIESEIWLPRAQRARRSYQPRQRRSCYGELIQLDGSDHEWFEDRAPRCTLLVYIDDATGKLMELRFVESETVFSYFEATRNYLDRHGKPVAFYSDKHSVFRVPNRDSPESGGVTQFGRALSALNIDIICADTPQAKGRVERVNRTLQDRLLKELRLRGISSMEAANAYVVEYMAAFNERFGRTPHIAYDAHRPLRSDEALDSVFTWQEQRKVTRNLTLNYKRKILMIEDTEANRALRGHRVWVHETEEGEVWLRHEGRTFAVDVFEKDRQVDQGAIVEHKHLGAVLKKIAEMQAARNPEAKRVRKTKRARRQFQAMVDAAAAK